MRLLVLLGIADFETTHWPLPLVVHDAVPPVLQEPLTVALETGPWLTSWSVIVTTAVQVFCWFVAVPSKSPMCIVGGLTVTLPFRTPVAPTLSRTVRLTA